MNDRKNYSTTWWRWRRGVAATPFWTRDEVESFTGDLNFPKDTTKWDKWVGFNFFYADTCRVLNARQAIEAGHQFYFNDIDAPDNKLYKYLEAMGII